MTKNIGKKLLLIAALTVMITGLSTAETSDANRTTGVNVTVASTVAVDLHPQNLTYPGMSVGSMTNTSSRGFTAVDVENVGSENIDTIWVNSTIPKSDPFATGNPSAYNSGNFFMIKPNNASEKLLGDSKEFHYVNRMEYATYNDDNIPSYIEAPDNADYPTTDGTSITGTSSASDVAVGRFRIGEAEYFYAMPVGTESLCDGGSSAEFNTLLVAKEPHTSEKTVPIDFTNDTVDDKGFPGISGRDYNVYSIQGSGVTPGVGATLLTGTPEENGVTLTVDPSEYSELDSELNRTYDVVTRCDTGASDVDQPFTIRTRYNVETGGITDLTDVTGSQASSYLMNTGVESQMLLPGESVTFDTAVEIPRGVAQGDIPFGELTIFVKSPA